MGQIMQTNRYTDAYHNLQEKKQRKVKLNSQRVIFSVHLSHL